MSLSIWEVFQALFRWGKGTDEEPSKEADEGRFVPSPLDLSVGSHTADRTIPSCVNSLR